MQEPELGHNIEIIASCRNDIQQMISNNLLSGRHKPFVNELMILINLTLRELKLIHSSNEIFPLEKLKLLENSNIYTLERGTLRNPF